MKYEREREFVRLQHDLTYTHSSVCEFVCVCVLFPLKLVARVNINIEWNNSRFNERFH